MSSSTSSTGNAASSSSSNGIGFCGLLTIAFIVLKLTHYIDWSWVWVLSPLWIGAAIGVGFVVVFLILALVASAIQALR